MVSKLQDATEYGLYVIESNDTYNYDWITNAAGDPGEARLDLMTEGLEMIHIADVKLVDDQGSCNFESEATYMGWEVKGIGAGKKDYRTFQDDHQNLMFSGEAADSTHADYIRRAFKEFNIERASIVKYLVWMRGADAYENWFDESGDSKDYCPVIWRLNHLRFDMKLKVYDLMLGFEVVWT